MTRRRGLKPKSWLTALLVSVVISVTFIAAGNDNRNFQIVKNLDIFYSLFRELNSYYVDETDPEELITTGIEAMLESLDPYTTFIPEEDMDDFRFMTTGEYGGIGSLITRREEYVVVSEPYEGMPAQEAGLRAGDRILKIDGNDMRGKETAQVSEKLKGPAGTEVTVVVARPGVDKELEIKIQRRVIQINPVPYYGMLNEETGIIILNNFTQNCANEVEKAFNDLKQNHNMRQLVLDLRGNPGGLMDESVKIANLFLPRGSEVVSTRGKVSQWDKTYRAPRAPIDTLMPMAVMINRGSASASEIVAGTLQDHDRALIIGQRSFGKGLVQTTRSLAYNSSLKVTTAKYYIPSGRCIQAVDYAKRNEDGSVALIPDSLMKEFQTKGGRIVLDGGGISPDVTLEPEKFSNITIALMIQQSIFDFATEFAIKHPSVAAPQEFTVDETLYSDFVNYIKGLDDFRYESELNDQFKKLKATAQKEEYYELGEEAFAELEKILTPNVERSLQLANDEVSELLAMELMRRYYYQRGAILYNLRFDKEITKAVETLNDAKAYRGMLQGSILTHAGDRRYN